ncbi:hypothetical protein ACF1BQ_035640 [Bradyrhizobium sp. RDT10]
MTSGAWRGGTADVASTGLASQGIYDKFDGEFASRSQTYASTGTVHYQW